MKKLLILLLMVVVFLLGCEKEKDLCFKCTEEATNNGYTHTDVYVICGTYSPQEVEDMLQTKYEYRANGRKVTTCKQTYQP